MHLVGQEIPRWRSWDKGVALERQISVQADLRKGLPILWWVWEPSASGVGGRWRRKHQETVKPKKHTHITFLCSLEWLLPALNLAFEWPTGVLD